MLADLKRLKQRLDSGSQAVQTAATSEGAGISKHRRTAFIFLILMVIVSGAIVGMYQWTVKKKPLPIVTQPEPFQEMTITRLTTTGKAADAAISPDGKYVAYSISDDRMKSLWLRQVAATGNVQILPPTKADIWGLTFPPDGNFIYYSLETSEGPWPDFYRMPVLGGKPAKGNGKC